MKIISSKTRRKYNINAVAKPFRRYTNLGATLRLLRDKNITLLNPAYWDDKNDSYFMAEYKRLKKAKTALALCFAEGLETYHHWRVFSNGNDGVCIQFDKHRLIKMLSAEGNVTTGRVRYRTLKSLNHEDIVADDLPFLKRRPYGDEREYRVVFWDRDEILDAKDYPIELDWIVRLTLSPWMPKVIARSVADTLRSIDGTRLRLLIRA